MKLYIQHDISYDTKGLVMVGASVGAYLNDLQTINEIMHVYCKLAYY